MTSICFTCMSHSSDHSSYKVAIINFPLFPMRTDVNCALTAVHFLKHNNQSQRSKRQLVWASTCKIYEKLNILIPLYIIAFNSPFHT